MTARRMADVGPSAWDPPAPAQRRLPDTGPSIPPALAARRRLPDVGPDRAPATPHDRRLPDAGPARDFGSVERELTPRVPDFGSVAGDPARAPRVPDFGSRRRMPDTGPSR